MALKKKGFLDCRSGPKVSYFRIFAIVLLRRRQKLGCFVASKLLLREIPKDFSDACLLVDFKGKDFNFNMIFFLTCGATGGVVWLDFATRDNFFHVMDREISTFSSMFRV